MKSVCFTAYNDENIGTLCNDEDDVYAVILRQTVRHSKPQQENEVSSSNSKKSMQSHSKLLVPTRESSKRERRCLMMIKTHKIDVIYLVSEVDDAAGLEGKRWREVIKYQLLTLFETI